MGLLRREGLGGVDINWEFPRGRAAHHATLIRASAAPRTPLAPWQRPGFDWKELGAYLAEEARDASLPKLELFVTVSGDAATARASYDAATLDQ